MIHQVILAKFAEGIKDEEIERLMRQTRMQLLKIPDVLTVRCGKKLQADQEWPFFVALEYDSKAKQGMVHDHPVYVKYRELLTESTESHQMLFFEMEPYKNVDHS
ncbi:MAG: Dabb family protein [Verrucomicrobiales bacterium]